MARPSTSVLMGWAMLALLTASPAHGQELLARLIDAADAYDPTLDVRRAESMAASARAWAQAATLTPRLGVTGRLVYNANPVTIDVPAGFVGGGAEQPIPAPGEPPTEQVTLIPEVQADATVRAVQPLLDVTAWHQARAARSAYRAAAAAYEVEVEDVSGAVIETYFAAVASRASALAAERQLERTREQADIVARQAVIGVASQEDLIAARSEVANAAAQTATDRTALAEQLTRLRWLTGVNVEPAQLERVPPEALRLPPRPIRVLDDRPAVTLARAQAEEAERLVDAAEAGWLPRVAGVVETTYTNASGFAGRKVAWAAGAELSWDVGVGTWLDARARRFDAAAADARVVAAERRVMEQQDVAWVRTEARLSTLGALRGAADAARQLAELGREQLALGLITRTDALLREERALAAEMALARAEAQVAEAVLLWRLQTGGPLFPDGVRPIGRPLVAPSIGARLPVPTCEPPAPVDPALPSLLCPDPTP